jgi:hypothetical protein
MEFPAAVYIKCTLMSYVTQDRHGLVYSSRPMPSLWSSQPINSSCSGCKSSRYIALASPAAAISGAASSYRNGSFTTVPASDSTSADTTAAYSHNSRALQTSLCITPCQQATVIAWFEILVDRWSLFTGIYFNRHRKLNKYHIQFILDVYYEFTQDEYCFSNL